MRTAREIFRHYPFGNTVERRKIHCKNPISAHGCACGDDDDVVRSDPLNSAALIQFASCDADSLVQPWCRHSGRGLKIKHTRDPSKLASLVIVQTFWTRAEGAARGTDHMSAAGPVSSRMHCPSIILYGVRFCGAGRWLATNPQRKR
ncbi:hypothetical protein A0H81_02303 [Grifola frondosa]|uniref:Uncharacterized protein n=1 Tax=Grifola frondosa TaxID=5627 RepID=A0A1C7MMC9_GRIFR|nr:hypothetical protein A0H81_02303 [Grifola frondosa]